LRRRYKIENIDAAISERCYAAFIENGAPMAVVLIVEDEFFVRDTADFTIGDLGHETLLACDVGEALSHLSSPGSIDALFVDMRLSAVALAGYEIADQAVKLRPDLRVLYTSGSALTEEMSGRFVAGGQFLQKPYSPAQLEYSMARLLQAEVSDSPSPT
jgi:CheY-like chemotaxis protein